MTIIPLLLAPWEFDLSKISEIQRVCLGFSPDATCATIRTRDVFLNWRFPGLACCTNHARSLGCDLDTIQPDLENGVWYETLIQVERRGLSDVPVSYLFLILSELTSVS